MEVTLDERFWSKVDKGDSPGSCWLWTAKTDDGYGRFWVKGPTRSESTFAPAHRLSLADAYGEFDPRLHADHLCRNRGCVNPEHLEAVTHRENVLRGTGASARNAAKLVCKNGHEFDMVDRRGARQCRTCINENGRRSYARRVSARAQTLETEARVRARRRR